MICLFHLLHSSRFINKTDIRVHKPTSLNMVLIQEVEYKRDNSSDSLKSHSHEISNIYMHTYTSGYGDSCRVSSNRLGQIEYIGSLHYLTGTISEHSIHLNQRFTYPTQV